MTTNYLHNDTDRSDWYAVRQSSSYLNNDWSKDSIRQIYKMPLLELFFRPLQYIDNFMILFMCNDAHYFPLKQELVLKTVLIAHNQLAMQPI